MNLHAHFHTSENNLQPATSLVFSGNTPIFIFSYLKKNLPVRRPNCYYGKRIWGVS